MVNYKVSKYIGINKVDESYEVFPEKYAMGYFIMHNEIEDSEYLVNSTVKYYLDKFSTYRTEEEVLKEVESDLQSDDRSIRETCSRFFNFLRKINILVAGNKIEEAITGDTLYKEGDMIGHLCISKILSSRSYTDIYQATSTRPDREYVIKLLNRKKTSSDARYQKEVTDLQQEYRMLQKARHIPAINKAYDFNPGGDRPPYIVLEYIDGKSLSRYIKEDGPSLTNSCCLQIIKEIIDAFSSLHENNILHGDIHSANILVTKENKVKIIDLGMSRDMDVQNSELVKSGGAYYYMPPERINMTSFKKFSADADLLSDVYQVGLLIYLVLYNTLPFEGFTWEELAQSIKENNITCPVVSFLSHPVSPHLINIVKRSLDKQLSKRYRSACEILTDFRKHIIAEKHLVEI